MGARKRNTAEKRNEAKSTVAIAKLNNVPTSPRKMRLLADLVRGENIYSALNMLKFNPKEASRNMEKLLLSAINNWEQKNEGKDATSADLVVKEVFVDSGRVLKRIQPAPQGRAHRIKKRSNHVTIIVDSAK
ncbi:50S ribosomal protein L22 [Flavobacteriales bacterium]|jgi:large subunit ribosomal protein L22|nr:50S ribosomal protein L22 [Flavobacteriales bacterium]|tara:strand:+ start:530 stop:925 length:396 start_codon:yes stop_codon:yes gene_type:complete